MSCGRCKPSLQRHIIHVQCTRLMYKHHSLRSSLHCLVLCSSLIFCSLAPNLHSHRMGMPPDGMERWGVVSIFKEAARLLHKHFRLFMPFVLVFCLPASSMAVFQYVFLLPSPHPYTSFVNAAAAKVIFVFRLVRILNSNRLCPYPVCLPSAKSFYRVRCRVMTVCQLVSQEGDVHTDSQPSLILIYTLALLVIIFSYLALAAYAYIVEYIYSNGDTAPDDDSIAKKVVKLLPHAFLRIIVTQLWIHLVLFLLAITCAIFAAILSAILSVLIGGPSSPTPAFYILFLLPFAIGTIAVVIMFALAQSIAVLEPEKYGRAALKQSIKYVKGRSFTVFRLCILSIAITASVYGLLRAVGKAELPVLVKLAVAIITSTLSSVISVYSGIVEVVLYFVCKSNFEAVLPEFQRGSNVPAAEIPYEPLVYGSCAQPIPMGEP